MKKFSKDSKERHVTAAIADEFYRGLTEILTTDAVVVGGGPAGLTAAMDISKDGFKVALIEANNYLGGGFWIGGFLMNTLTFRDPGQKLLEELDIPHKRVREGLYTASGPAACSKLISRTCEAGVNILNMVKFDDVVYRNGRVDGVVINWTPVSALPRQLTCVDPVALETTVVIDATGHDAVVCRSLDRRGIIKVKDYGPMDVENSEDLVVEKTCEIHPGLIVAGMAVSTAFGVPRMGPTFSGMLYSGKKAAEIAKGIIFNRIDKKGAAVLQGSGV